MVIDKFKNRNEAGKRLAEALKQYRNKDVVVYALPRGGIVIGYEIAKFLHAPLDIIVARKIGHPYSPEYAIGAVAENGHHIFNSFEMRLINTDWLKDKIQTERNEAKRRRETYLQGKKPVSAQGKIAILVDDGVATGLTLRVGIVELKHSHPKKLVVAVPVAPSDVEEEIKNKVDEFITLLTPIDYKGAVGAYYDDFPQVTDEEVIKLLNASRRLK